MEKTIENVKLYIEKGYSIRQLAKVFGCTTTPMRLWLKRRGLTTKAQRGHHNGRTWTDADLISAVKESETKASVLRKLGLRVRPGNYDTINKYIARLNLDTSHFSGKGYGIGPKPNTRSLASVLVENSDYHGSRLKKRLLKEGLLENKCSICGNTGKWQNKHLVMVLDHINGTNNDNRLENLRMLCPNCNSQQETFCRRKSKPKPEKTCEQCGKALEKRNITGRCLACGVPHLKARKVKNRPSKDILLEEIDKLGYEAVGRKYGVTGNAVRKWVI